LRRNGCIVTAVDRSQLDDTLMADPAVTFVRGDAFTFTPEDPPVDWVVSDVIAYPERCVELLERWCGGLWASRLIFTMKFTGDVPDFVAMAEARAVAERLGFRARLKHFFANKNEVTVMAWRPEGDRDEGGGPGTPAERHAASVAD
jgi:23S rRNA (cytidine2498-2'-O)-methyltransferase